MALALLLLFAHPAKAPVEPEHARDLKDFDPVLVEELRREQKFNERHQDLQIWADITDYRKTVAKPYWPDTGGEFYLETLMLKPEDVVIYSLDPLPPSLIRQQGRRIRFFVHPESKAQYQQAYKRREFVRDTKASPYASFRSLLAWDTQGKEPPFGVKVSLNKAVGVMNRNLAEVEVKHSVAISALLRKLDKKQWRKKGINFIEDPIGIVPTRIKDAGLLFRSLPKTPKGTELWPLFSLFSKRGDKEPKIVELIRGSGMPAKDFVKKFVDTMNEQAVERAFSEGIISEDHEQNVLAEVSKGKLTGQFWYRDLGAVKIDETLRHAAGKDLSFLPSWATPEDVLFSSRRGFLYHHTLYVRDAMLYSLGQAVAPYFPEITVDSIKKEFEDDLAQRVGKRIGQKDLQFKDLTTKFEEFRKQHPVDGKDYKTSTDSYTCKGVLERIWGDD